MAAPWPEPHALDAATGAAKVSDIPTCDLTGEDVDDCPCVDVRDYDERDEADERQQHELDERERDV